MPNSKAACYINDIFVKSFVGINPLVEADTKVEINKIDLSTPITINGVEYQTKFVLNTDKKFNLVSLDEIRQQYYPNVTGKVIYYCCPVK